MPRDPNDFLDKTKKTLAKRAAESCSNPKCPQTTSGPHTDPDKAVNLGEAAHIRGALPGTARYDPLMTAAQRRDISNGIWLCRTCAGLIDRDPSKYPVDLLNQWKMEHEHRISQGGTKLNDSPQLTVQASPTRNGPIQLAHITARNTGNRPVRIEWWHCEWGHGKPNESSIAQSAHEKLPVVLREQEAVDLLVELNERPLKELTKLGVVDADHRLWDLSEDAICQFVAVAERHQFPYHLIGEQVSIPETPSGQKLEITARARSNPLSFPDTLEITVRNTGDIPVRILGVSLSWEYETPTQLDPPGPRPRVAEIGGSINFANLQQAKALGPSESRVYALADDFAPILYSACSPNVPPDKLKVLVKTSKTGVWCLTNEGLPEAVRTVAASNAKAQALRAGPGKFLR